MGLCYLSSAITFDSPWALRLASRWLYEQNYGPCMDKSRVKCPHAQVEPTYLQFCRLLLHVGRGAEAGVDPALPPRAQHLRTPLHRSPD